MPIRIEVPRSKAEGFEGEGYMEGVSPSPEEVYPF